MDLYKQIIIGVLAREEARVSFSDFVLDATKIVELESYTALERIKTIIEDDSLSDSECFMKIEEIVRVFEEMGSDGGVRHDFG